ncbi:MAG: AMP-dependent synthetase [Bacteriovoracaceae bacterium]|nr:AMP-dependent synthetase [Bacteriovoracaceae bacterium]
MIVYEPRAKWTQDSFVAKFIEKAGCKDFPSLLLKSQKDPEWFWELALKDMGLQFRTPYKKLLAEGLPWPKWALGGEISVVENCIDRHLKDHGSDTALIFEADKPGESVSWTFNDLARESHFIAEELKKKGAQKGDRAALLMPMSLEMAAAFFGILRAGLTVVPIFSGYGAEAISSRLEDSKARFIFVQEKTTRRGKEIPVRSTLDEALKTSPSIEHTLILKRADFISQNHQASSSYHSVASPAESPVLLLYTSGTTGKPKACVHTSFGVLATTGKELRYTFDVKRSDRFFWYTDIGWMMGPWELFGVLQYGAAVVLFEGVPDFPEPDRLWKIIDDHQITHLGIAPTAIRVLKKAGDSFVEKHSLKSLRILGSSGETWDEESWKWFFEKVGKTKCPIMNMSG